MANEEQLRKNWDEVFHNSSEYQRAKQEDSYVMTRRERAARDDMQAALLRGDTRRASSIQQQLQRDQSRPGVYSEAANNYQKQRVTDYIDQARTNGRKQASEIQGRPLAGVSYSGNYLQELQNPDFSNYFPTSNLAMRFNIAAPGKPVQSPAGRPAAAPVAGAPKPDKTGALQAARRNGAQGQDAAMIRERDFNRNLAPELRVPMTNYLAQATAQEKKDFLSYDPVRRTAKLREQQYRDSRVPTATPPPMSATSKPGTPLFSSTLQIPGGNTGFGLEESSPYVPRNTMPLTSPVLSSKPSNALAKPPTPTVPKTGSPLFKDVLDDSYNNDIGY